MQDTWLEALDLIAFMPPLEVMSAFAALVVYHIHKIWGYDKYGIPGKVYQPYQTYPNLGNIKRSMNSFHSDVSFLRMPVNYPLTSFPLGN